MNIMKEKQGFWYFAVLFASICSQFASFATAGNNVEDEVSSSKAALEKWVETQRVISQEKRDFVLSKEMLSERIKLLEREIEELERKVVTAKGNISDADSKRSQIVKDSHKFNDNFTVLQNIIGRLEDGIKDIIKKLPENVDAHIKPLSQRLPDPENTTKKISLSERFQNVIGMLNEIDKFNREISLTSEVRTLEDGSSVEVTTVYIGIGQAYFVNTTGDIAGVGNVTEDGWQWQENDEIAPAISEVISILKNEKVASYVKLPIEIK